MTARRFFSGFVATALAALTFVPWAVHANDRSFETRGTLTSAANGQIVGNVWSGLSRSDALLLIDALPARYASPVYYDLARRLLLSDAPSLPADPVKQLAKGEKDNATPADPTRPDVLIARLDKLLQMGALRDAENLYDTVAPDTPQNFDLVLRSQEILMLRGQLSAACLDLQAMQAQHGGNPEWKELNRLCRIQFASGGERARLVGESKFIRFPQLNNYVHGRGPGNLARLSAQDMAFAVATGLINPSMIRSLSPKAGQMPPLLLSVLYQMDPDQPAPEKACLLIEAVRRGMASTRDLITLYEKPHYDSSLLLGSPGAVPPLGNVHPCMAPSVLYQRIASADSGPAARDATIRVALDLMDDLPDAALWPMAFYFKDFRVHDPANRKYLWRVARILAYEKGEFPADWTQGWTARTDKGAQVSGVAPFWPIAAIIAPGAQPPEDLNIWRGEWPNEARRIAGRDPILPLLLGQAVEAGKTGKNPKTNLRDYDNKLSLTFSRSYAMPSYGLTERLADVIEKGQTGQSVALLLIGYGAIPPDQVIPHQMALVIDGMNKAGLGRSAQRFALEVLR
ncbi:MAG: hypothetical protein H6865_00400 [Rhodospirillales bacterium]|nr:hypothetical protein [Alphaproteobacteria bacterium]MCB9986086.1 hypothetical protein [Rhodospirillales bacterium]USO07349.1 MAG: hypothetical protein H6866_07975 [Rhodospirillales bacterium]